MSTATKTRPDTHTNTGNFRPVVNHYVPSWQITESIVMGTKVTALCGHQYVVKGRGNGSASDSKGVTCPMCADVYAGLSLN
jgi:hypothetical protein